jgi:hypothetical protein
LAEKRITGVKGTSGLHPFDNNIVEAVRQAVKDNPKKFLEKLGVLSASLRTGLRRGESAEQSRWAILYRRPAAHNSLNPANRLLCSGNAIPTGHGQVFLAI